MKYQKNPNRRCWYALWLQVLLLACAPLTSRSQGLFQRLAGFASGKKGGKGSSSNDDGGGLNDVLSTTLSNGVEVPLVGVGVGNMLPEVIPAIISHALRDDKRIRLIDTSNVSQTEHLVAAGIVEGTEYVMKHRQNTEEDETLEVHVITKVWYTHLGYERTRWAVQNSLDALKPALDHPNVDLKLHVMLQWPRCFDTIPWMHCEEEEAQLDPQVKQAGPPPHLDKTNAWKESWKALEAMVQEPDSPIVSIGVSNFHLKDLQTLTEFATIYPHMVEANLWSLLYDPLLIDFCHSNKIHLTVFHILESSLRHAQKNPFALHHLLTVANQLSKTMANQGKTFLNKGEEHLSPVQVVLAWLVQHSISVIPRTTDLAHLKENSAVALEQIPFYTNEQTQIVATSVEAMMTNEDLEKDSGIEVSFHAKTKNIWLYWRDDEDDWQHLLAVIPKGETFVDLTHPGHKFRAYEEPDKTGKFETFHIQGKYGDTHHVEL